MADGMGLGDDGYEQGYESGYEEQYPEEGLEYGQDDGGTGYGGDAGAGKMSRIKRRVHF